MLDLAIKFDSALRRKMIDTWYDPEYFSYYSNEMFIPDFSSSPNGHRDFVSLNERGDIIGYFSYQVDVRTMSASNFGLISFEKGNLIFLRDVMQAIDDIFVKFNLNRMEWMCYASNPALSGYRKFIKRYGGEEVGVLHKAALTADGLLQDVHLFELMAEDYLKARRRN